MADLSIFKLDSETITIKDTTARQTADSAKTLATTASGNATTAINKINELESEKADAIISSTSGAIASFPDGAESTAKKLVVGIEPVQEGTGDPSPDNVRPISGWTGAKVTRTGKNLLSNTVNSISKNGITFTVNEDRSITVNGTATARANLYYSGKLYIPPADYYLSIGKTFAMGQCYFEMVLYKAATGSNQYINTNARSGCPFTVEKGDYIQEIYFSVFEGKTVNDTIYPQIELGSTVTAYEPYQGQTYGMTFPSEAGTVYGGSLDVTTGVLTVYRAQIASYNGETLPGKWISDRDVYAAGASPTTGAQVVYELASPITYRLTPQEITTLIGQNNIWADTGDTSVTYRADTKLYIDKKFTEIRALILEN